MFHTKWKPCLRFCRAFSNEQSSHNTINYKEFFDKLGKRLQIKDWTDWYQVKQYVVKNNLGGTKIMKIFHGSISAALIAAYPQYNWQPWRFSQLPPKEYFEDISNIRNIFLEIEKEWKIKEWNVWYSIDIDKLCTHFPIMKEISKYYGESVIKALITAFPDRPWDVREFAVHLPSQKLPWGFWKDIKFQRNFFDSLAKQLHIKKRADWYLVNSRDIIKNGGGALLRHYYDNSPIKALMSVYPEYSWIQPVTRFSNTGSKSQSRVFDILSSLFPEGTDLFMNFSYESSEGNTIEFDVAVPSFSIAFEYQGEQHYKDIEIALTTDLKRRKEIDQSKREICKKEGITLLEIPYWWDGLKSSLATMIKQAVH